MSGGGGDGGSGDAGAGRTTMGELFGEALLVLSPPPPLAPLLAPLALLAGATGGDDGASSQAAWAMAERGSGICTSRGPATRRVRACVRAAIEGSACELRGSHMPSQRAARAMAVDLSACAP